MSTEITIHVIKVSGEFPEGRESAARFREEHLIPSLDLHDIVTVDFRGTFGVVAPWIKEAFRGLVTPNALERIRILSEDPTDGILVRRILTESTP
ncbi:MAG: STAS-like domain-containing protein [Cyclobacteriaceae bacterium]|nr:STAS-like domain-containing protein [Cyclobacteriaceae bacterium]